MADTFFGGSISFASGFLAQILSVTLPEQVREAIDTTHATTTSGKMTFIPSDLIDGGELQVELNFSETTSPPIGSAAETVTITFASGTTWAFTGFLTNYGGEAPIDDRMTASATIKVSGAITIT